MVVAPFGKEIARRSSAPSPFWKRLPSASPSRYYSSRLAVEPFQRMECSGPTVLGVAATRCVIIHDRRVSNGECTVEYCSVKIARSMESAATGQALLLRSNRFPGRRLYGTTRRATDMLEVTSLVLRLPSKVQPDVTRDHIAGDTSATAVGRVK